MYKLTIILLLISSLALAKTQDKKEPDRTIFSVEYGPEKEEPLFKPNEQTETYLKLSHIQKIQVITRLIQNYKKDGIIIKKNPEYYVMLLDDMVDEFPILISYPLKEVFERACKEEKDFNSR